MWIGTAIPRPSLPIFWMIGNRLRQNHAALFLAIIPFPGGHRLPGGTVHYLPIPTDVDVVPATLELLERWGADAIRDCDGTDYPEGLKSVDAKVYSTYYTKLPPAPYETPS